MITRFDHAVIAVRDLDAAMRAYSRLGFTVTRGGRHPGRGTENAIIRFGLDYLELLAVADAAEARASGWDEAALESFARGGLIDFALASDDLAGDAARLRVAGVSVQGPFDGSRRRPDGSLLAWQTLALAQPGSTGVAAPGFAHLRDPWPFLIQWRTSDAERIAGDQAGPQPNGVTGVWGISALVRDLDAAIGVYQNGLGLPLTERVPIDGMAAERARFTIGAIGSSGSNGGGRLDLLSPTGEGIAAQALATQGEGFFSVLLAAPQYDMTREYLAAAGMPASPVPGEHDELLIAPEVAQGARLIVRAAR